MGRTRRRPSHEYEEFISTHELNCDINDHGSAGSVEADGLIECFQVSEKDRKLRCINYLGDGIQNRFRNIKTGYISTKTSKKAK